MVQFKTRKRDGQAFPIAGKVARDSGNPSYVAKVNPAQFKQVKLKKDEKFQCTSCQKVYSKAKKEDAYYVCPECGSMEAEVINSSKKFVYINSIGDDVTKEVNMSSFRAHQKSTGSYGEPQHEVANYVYEVLSIEKDVNYNKAVYKIMKSLKQRGYIRKDSWTNKAY